MTGRDFGRCCLVLALFAASPGPPAFALGTAFTYQGQLQQGGAPTNGSCDFQFSLWDELGSGAPPAGGDQIGSTQTKSSVNVSNGVFTVPLDFGAAAFSSASDRWLHIAVRCPAGGGSYQALAPRQPLTPAPFALFANTIADGSVSSAKLALDTVTTPHLATEAVTAAKIGDGAVTSAKLAAGAVMTSQLATNAVTAAQIADGTIAANDLANGAVSTAKIGDGQVTSAKLVAPLRLTSSVANTKIGAFDGTSTGLNGVGVSGTAGSGDDSAGVFGFANAGTGGGAGVRGLSLEGIGVLGEGEEIGVKGTSDEGDGVMGLSSENNGTGVHGVATGLGMPNGVVGESAGGFGVAGTGGIAGVAGTGSWGVYGVTLSPQGNGVYGTSLGSNDTSAVGVRGAAKQGIGVRGESTSGYGVYGQSSASGSSGDAVRGEGFGPSGNGVHGIANNGTGAYGVFGESSSGYAGYFSGKVQVTGTLTKGSGSFKIDHPLDPANKYLSHSFVESPDMKNIYDGIAVLDDDGQADVELPNWFETLNRDFRYQLTCLGAFAPVYVAEEIHDNRFRIAGGTPGQKISWLVTGTRQDAYANAHRIVVEEDKSAPEAGRYLHPVEHGMPESLSVSAAKDSASTKE